MSVLFEFFEKIDRDKWSGEVHVTSSQGHAYLLFKGGSLVWAHRPLDRAIERFQKIEWLKLPPLEILNNLRSWEALVRDLLNANHEQYGRLVRFLKTDRLEIFFRVFFWSNIELLPRGFDVQLPDPVQFGFYTQKRMAPLLEEARKRLREWPTIQDRMGNSKRVFVSTVEIPELSDRQLDAVDRALLKLDDDGMGSQDASLQSLPYSLEEIEILKLCNGSMNVQEIIKQSLEGEFLVLRRMMHLWAKGALRPKDEQVLERKEQAFSTGARDWMYGVWVVFWVLALSMILSILEGISPPVGLVPTSLTQAIEVFRVKRGHYPLSLEELSNEPALSGIPTDAYVYTLVQSDEYKILNKR